MSLTAKEWLLLPEDEQIRRANEVPPHECFLLRVLYAEVHFTEEQKANMTQEERDEFLREPTEEEILRGKHASFDAMKMFEMIPEERKREVMIYKAIIGGFDKWKNILN